MERQKLIRGLGPGSRVSVGACLLVSAVLASAAFAQGPLAAKINVTPLASYTGTTPLAKPDKILVYDFAINPDDVQVDKVQSMRPRHLIAGDESPDAIAASASKHYSQELIKQLGKTGIPVEHMAKDAPAPANALVIQGSFTSLKQGNKTERDTMGMGAGGADVQTKVDVHLKTPSDSVLFSQFQTDTQDRQECRLCDSRGSWCESSGGCRQINRRRPAEECRRLRLEDGGCRRERDHQVHGCAGLGQDQRQGRVGGRCEVRVPSDILWHGGKLPPRRKLYEKDGVCGSAVPLGGPDRCGTNEFAADQGYG